MFCLSVCLSVRFCVSLCARLKCFVDPQTGWRRCARSADVDLKAMHLTAGHVVSIHPHRPLACSPARSPTHPPIHPVHPIPARRHTNPPPNRQKQNCKCPNGQISLKAFQDNPLDPGHAVSLPRIPDRPPARERQAAPPTNPLTRLLTNIPHPTERRGILGSAANL